MSVPEKVSVLVFDRDTQSEERWQALIPQKLSAAPHPGLKLLSEGLDRPASPR